MFLIWINDLQQNHSLKFASKKPIAMKNHVKMHMIKSEEIVMKNNCIKKKCNVKNHIKIHMRNKKINNYELRRIEHNYHGQLNYVIQWRSENRHMYALLK